MRIVYHNTHTDQTCVVIPARGRNLNAGETAQQYLAWLLAREGYFRWRLAAGLGLPPYRVVDEATLPPRRWRNAWRFAAGTLTVDETEARRVRKAELVRRIQERRGEIDAQILDAVDDGDSAAEQAARDRRRNLRIRLLALDADLAGLDLAGLESYQPPELDVQNQ